VTAQCIQLQSYSDLDATVTFHHHRCKWEWVIQMNAVIKVAYRYPSYKWQKTHTLRISLSPSIISLLLLQTFTLWLWFFFFSLLVLSKLPSWAKAFVPRFFYVTEKAWNFYPYTITGVCVYFFSSVCVTHKLTYTSVHMQSFFTCNSWFFKCHQLFITVYICITLVVKWMCVWLWFHAHAYE